jgi:ketosteroid isomerase-like protein
MSRENVELVEAVWAEFRQGRFPADSFSDDVAWHVAADEPEGGSDGGPVRGPAEVRQMLASFWETVEQAWVRAEEFVAAGDQVIVRWVGGGIGRASGIPVEWPETHVYTVRQGTVAEFASTVTSPRLSKPVSAIDTRGEPGAPPLGASRERSK